MNDLAAEVTAALSRSILPSVIARGAVTLRVAAAENGVVTLQSGRLPGRRAPDPGPDRDADPRGRARRDRRQASLAGPAPSEPGDLAEAARAILDADINPAIAAHRGHVAVAGAAGGWIRIRLEGGCQGCSLAEVTLRQGIEPLLRAGLPRLTGLADVTDHEAGAEPFFSPEKR